MKKTNNWRVIFSGPPITSAWTADFLSNNYSLLLNLTRKLESSLGCNWVFPYWYMFTETCQGGNQEKPLKLNSNFVLYIRKVNKLKATGVCPKLPEHGNSLHFIIIFKGDRVYPATLSQDWWRYNTQREKAGLHSQRVYGHREFQKKNDCMWLTTDLRGDFEAEHRRTREPAVSARARGACRTVTGTSLCPPASC